MKKSVEVSDLVLLNDYIKRKYRVDTDLLHCTGRVFALIDLHSTSGDMSIYKTIKVDELTVEDLKKWIKLILN